MKKLAIVILMIILSVIVSAYPEDYVGDIKEVAPKNGQVMKNDSTLVNEADSAKTIQFTHDLSTGALDYTSAFTGSVRILEIEIVFDAAVTETVTVTKAFTSADYNTLRKTLDLSANTDFVFNDQIFLISGNQIKIGCTAATAVTNARVTITYSELVR